MVQADNFDSDPNKLEREILREWLHNALPIWIFLLVILILLIILVR